MPAWPLPTRPILLLSTLVALAACGGGKGDEFPPVCPQVGIPPDAADLGLYRSSGHDLTDLQINASVRGIQGTCKPGAKDQLAAKVAVGFRVARGPAATSSTIDLPYFIAVMQGDQILDKHDYVLHVVFPSNTQSIDLNGEPVDLLLPTPQGTTGAAYQVLAGFQLTPDQLEQNRARAAP